MNDSQSPLRCPICGSRAEQICLYASDQSDIRWLPGRPSWKNNLKAAFTGGERVGNFFDPLAGTYAEAILCRECNHIMIDHKPPKNHYPDLKE